MFLRTRLNIADTQREYVKNAYRKYWDKRLQKYQHFCNGSAKAVYRNKYIIPITKIHIDTR